MPNEHDIRYKKLFSNPILVKELLQSFVNEDFMNELNFSTLERLDKSFITEKFKEKESDLIYKIKFHDKDIYIYLLFEFQSYVDKFMSLRILRYICEFYEYLIQKKVKKLPAIFPVLLYNGDKKWTAKYEIKDLIENTIPDKYIPEFSYYPILENEFSKETLLTIKNAVSAIFYVENSNIEEIRKEIHKIIKLLETEKPEIIILFRRWINNLFGFKDREINKSIMDMEEIKDMFSTSLEKYKKKLLKEGMEKGVEEGIEKGVNITKLNTAKKMLSLGFSTDDISAITGFSKKKIEGLKKK